MLTQIKPSTSKTQYNTTEIQTLKLAILDAIEHAEARGDLNLAVVYANLLRKKIDPALKLGYRL